MRSDSILKPIRVVRTSMAPQGEDVANCRLEVALRHSSALEGSKRVPCTVLAGNSDLLGSLRHLG
jgi:hypothetical protein